MKKYITDENTGINYTLDVDVRATEMYDTLVKQLAKQEGVTEKLKATDMMLWAQKLTISIIVQQKL